MPASAPPGAASAEASPVPAASPAATLLPSPTLSMLADEAHVTLVSQVVYYRLGDPAYVEAAREVANGVLVGGELDSTRLFANFDWSQVLDHWSSVEAQLNQGIVPYADQIDWSEADRLIAFAQANHMPVYGGTMVWAGDIPASILHANYSAAQLREILEYITKAKVLHYKGRIAEWYVAAELAASLLFGNGTQRFWWDHLGLQAVYDAFTWAHEADPKARLMIVEGPLLEANNDAYARIKAEFFSILADLKARKIPVNDVAPENNFWIYAPPNTADMVATLQRIKALGYGIGPSQTIVSESAKDAFWPDRPRTVASVPDPGKAQAAIYRAVFNAYLETGSPFGIFGFTDAVSEFGPGKGNYNVPDAKAMILDENYQPKAAYFALVADLKAYLAR